MSLNNINDIYIYIYIYVCVRARVCVCVCVCVKNLWYVQNFRIALSRAHIVCSKKGPYFFSLMSLQRNTMTANRSKQ